MESNANKVQIEAIQDNHECTTYCNHQSSCNLYPWTGRWYVKRQQPYFAANSERANRQPYANDQGKANIPRDCEVRRAVYNKSEKCDKILETEDWCNVLRDVSNIIRPEWEELFPKTRFYVVRSMAYTGESEVQNNYLIIEQDGQRYTDKTFDQLLDVNGIVISDENSESVAKALALMTLPDYLGNGITFTKWEKEPTPPPANSEYCLTAWAKIQGWELN
jgi:hypothetical protein